MYAGMHATMRQQTTLLFVDLKMISHTVIKSGDCSIDMPLVFDNGQPQEYHSSAGIATGAGPLHRHEHQRCVNRMLHKQSSTS